jgi:hypothetical protein
LPLRHRSVFGNKTLDSIAAEASAGAGWKYGIICAPRPLHEPDPQCCRPGARERSQAFFAHFAVAAHVGIDAEHDERGMSAGEFRRDSSCGQRH